MTKEEIELRRKSIGCEKRYCNRCECVETGCELYRQKIHNEKIRNVVVTVLDTENEILKDIADNKLPKPATREEYIRILAERVDEEICRKTILVV